jgi:hypothetical protein
MPARLLTFLCLPLLCSACATLPAPPTRPEPPPPALAAPCDAGPDYPEGDPRLADLLEVVRQREVAAADCRARHKALADAWPR